MPPDRNTGPGGRPASESARRAPFVSIVCAAYQHEALLRDALEGFLSQRIGFPIEIIVHDDASTDGTPAVIKAFSESHPGIVVPILQQVNQRSQGRKPWPFCFERVKGRYVAFCDGDDFWIDPTKLQRQVELLEEDPGAAGCFSNAYNEADGSRTIFLGKGNAVPRSNRLDLEGFLHGQGIPTSTFICRSADLVGFAELVRPFASGDTALFTMLLRKGHFIYVPEPTAVRRIHEGGVYSMKSAVHRLGIQLRNLREQERLVGGIHKDIFRKRWRYALTRAWSEGIEKDNRELMRLAWGNLARERRAADWRITDVCVNGVRAYLPGLYKVLNKVFWRARIALQRVHHG